MSEIRGCIPSSRRNSFRKRSSIHAFAQASLFLLSWYSTTVVCHGMICSPSKAMFRISNSGITLKETRGCFHYRFAPKILLRKSSILCSNSNSNAVDTTTTHTVRRPIIAGNWKLNPGTVGEAKTLLKLLRTNFVNHETLSESTPEVIVFPPFPFLILAMDILDGTDIHVGAQNIGLQDKGAYTGEVSASMIQSLGCDYVMLGHSERRILFKETDKMINQKVHLALQQPDLSIVLCVGETLEEYENDLLQSVVTLQIKKGLMGVSIETLLLHRIIVAYEPVWAIGTGKVATPDQAQRAHEAIRGALSAMYDDNVAKDIIIQYGGSVQPESIESLMAMPDVDGALVGGASLTADSFYGIVDGAVDTTSSKIDYSILV